MFFNKLSTLRCLQPLTEIHSTAFTHCTLDRQKRSSKLRLIVRLHDFNLAIYKKTLSSAITLAIVLEKISNSRLNS